MGNLAGWMRGHDTPETDKLPRPKKYTIRDWWVSHKGQKWFIYRTRYEWEKWWQIWHLWHRWGGKIPEMWYYIKCKVLPWKRFNTVVCETEPPTWQDRSEILLSASFQILGEYLLKEKALDTIDTSDDVAPDGIVTGWASAFKEMRELWHWWCVLRPAREDEYARRLHAWHELFSRDRKAWTNRHPDFEKPRVIDMGNGKQEKVYQWSIPEGEHWETEETKKAHAYMEELSEQKRDDEDDAMLIRLINIRGYLWT